MHSKLKKFFEAKSIAIIGASKNPSKVGGVILNNMIKNGYAGKIFPVNPKYKEIEGIKCYPSVLKIKEKVDSAVIAIPSKFVNSVVKECAKKGIKHIVIISGGFGESGELKLEKELKKTIKETGINVIGPNCVGIISSKSRIDSVFFPLHKLKRPSYGNISIVSQSGGTGIILLSLFEENGVGLNKFISFGNAYDVDESDLLRFLADDEETKTIILYIEGVKRGKEFIESLSYASSKKPVIVLKAGKYGRAKSAAKTHTGAIAGDYLAYKAVFRKAGALEVENMNQLFNLLLIFNQPFIRGKRIGVITNGGGLGVMSSDELEKRNLLIPEIDKSLKKKLSSFLPSYATPANPLDLIADADVETYKKAITYFMNSELFDALIVNVLFQSPKIDDNMLNILLSVEKKKPLILVVPGGGVAKNFREILNLNGIPSFESPEEAVFALRKLYEYSKFRRKAKRS